MKWSTSRRDIEEHQVSFVCFTYVYSDSSLRNYMPLEQGQEQQQQQQQRGQQQRQHLKPRPFQQEQLSCSQHSGVPNNTNQQTHAGCGRHCNITRDSWCRFPRRLPGWCRWWSSRSLILLLALLLLLPPTICARNPLTEWWHRCREGHEVRRALKLTDCESGKHDFYRLMRVRRGETRTSRLRAARKDLLKKLHPDKNRHPRAAEAFHAAQAAYETLLTTRSKPVRAGGECRAPCECDRSDHDLTLRSRAAAAQRHRLENLKYWQGVAASAWRQKKPIGVGMIVAYSAIGVLFAKLPPVPPPTPDAATETPPPWDMGDHRGDPY